MTAALHELLNIKLSQSFYMDVVTIYPISCLYGHCDNLPSLLVMDIVIIYLTA